MNSLAQHGKNVTQLVNLNVIRSVSSYPTVFTEHWTQCGRLVYHVPC